MINRDYEVVIGLEVHAELCTETKIFCGCKNAFGAEVNTLCCPVCMGMPGTLPVLNKQVVDYAIKMGHALNCSINRVSKNDRKNYFYPPFAQMLKLQVVDKDEGAGLALAQQVVFYLQSLKLQGKLEDLLIAGPFPSLVAKAYDLYRFNVLLKAQDLRETKEALLNSEFKEKPNLYFNVDPVSVI